MTSSMAVTTAAMISTKTGKRISDVMECRTNDIKVLDTTSVNMVASPKPRPLTKLVVTAINGHSPSSCTKPGLFFQSPSRVICR